MEESKVGRDREREEEVLVGEEKDVFSVTREYTNAEDGKGPREQQFGSIRRLNSAHDEKKYMLRSTIHTLTHV